MKATITVPKSRELLALFKTERASFKHARASYEITEQSKELVIEIEAKDASALKATMASICRTVTVHEKASKV